MSSLEYPVAPRSVDVLPARVTRRLTRRDGLLPLVFAVELLAGIAFGVAAHSGEAAPTSTPAPLSLAPVALVTVLPSTAPALDPVVGPPSQVT
ncbi:MAG: hypothetical protein QOJ79_1555 [Actinomycetota bacterium]|nr:hypothetical protein [Actinomycetota bacterium]